MLIVICGNWNINGVWNVGIASLPSAFLLVAGGGAGGQGGGGAGGVPNPGASSGGGSFRTPGTSGRGGGGGYGYGNVIYGGSGTVILAVPTPYYPGSAPGAAVTAPPAAPGKTVLTYTTPNPAIPATFTYIA